MADEIVLFEKADGVGLITMNRPGVKNSLSLEVFRTLNDILDRVTRDDEVRAVVVTGAGSAFVAGADINDLLGFDTQTGWAASRFQQSVFNRLERLGKPSIAAINGFALGGGLELALACTFRVASVNARMGFPEMGLGIIPALGGTQRAVRTVGYAKASELILSRSIIDAEEAYRIGLVNRLAEAVQVLARAMEWAKALAALSPVAMRMELELLHQTQDRGFDAGLALESALAALTVSSGEAKKLLGDFAGKVKKK
ncbi:MAG: enoyl-CoA hydratase/isomerase family protein [Syntrophorhabdales bacterium]|jgi:enoyl-CoA hydratase